MGREGPPAAHHSSCGGYPHPDRARADRSSRIPSTLQGVGCALPDLSKHGLSTDAIEGIGEVEEEAPALIRVVGGGEQMGSGVNDGLAAAFYSHAKLKGGE